MSSTSNTSFAAATRPITAGTVISTDSIGIVSGEIAIAAADGRTLPAWRSAPLDAPGAPVILVVQEIFGVHEHIKDITRRLAKLGYLAIAPELYFRQGDPSRIDNIDELRTAIISKVPDEQVLADLDATVAWATEQGGDVDRLGITGFCWGGRIVWLYAAHQPKIKAGVAWYGRLVGDPTALTPTFPIDVAPRLKAPVLGLYGGQDQGIPLDSVERFQKALQAGDGRSSVHVYPDAPHAFYADYRPSYRAPEAQDGWRRLQEWFKNHGV